MNVEDTGGEEAKIILNFIIKKKDNFIIKKKDKNKKT